MKKIRPYITSVLLCFILCSEVLIAQRVASIWEINQQEELGGELYQTTFLLEKMMVIGTTRYKVVGIDFSGKLNTIITLQPGQGAVLSPDGKYIGVSSIKHEFIDHFELKTVTNDPVFNLKLEEGFIDFLIGTDSKMIVGKSVSKRLEGTELRHIYHFYDTSGNELGQAKVNKPTATSLAPDGKALGVNDSESGLTVFSKDGTKLWNVKESYRNFELANSAEQIIGNSAILIRQVAHLGDGRTLDSLSLKNPVYNVRISSDGNIKLITERRSIHYFEDRLERANWEYTFEDERLTINSVAVSNTGYVACGLIKDNGEDLPLERRYTECSVYLFDKTGNINWQVKYELSRSNAWIPVVSLIPVNENQSVLTVRTREKLYLYSIDH